MRTLQEISHDSFYKMENYHQLTIDLIEETERLFNDQIYTEEEKRERIEQLGAHSYDISTILEIFNFNYIQEIADLKDILSHIEIRIGKLESMEFKNV